MPGIPSKAVSNETLSARDALHGGCGGKESARTLDIGQLDRIDDIDDVAGPGRRPVMPRKWHRSCTGADLWWGD
jgi:hypothetical protein